MKQRVLSLCWGSAWDRYGEDFVATFAKHWPQDVDLALVTDERRGLPRGREMMLGDAPGYHAFMSRWKDDARAQGRFSRDRKAKPGVRFWKHDAVKWAPQGLCPVMGLDGLECGDILAWFDADVMTHKAVPEGWLGELLDGHDVACLQRRSQHSEIGFWAIRVSGPTRRFVNAFADYYASGRVFALDEWHSAYVFDAALKQARLKVRNLNPTMARGHCWPITPLAHHTTHLKGKLKPQ